MMRFSFYDLISQVVLGFVWLTGIIYLFFASKLIGPKELAELSKLQLFALPISYILGFFINAIGSWTEKFLFWTWGGKPSQLLLINKSTSSKVKSVPYKKLLEHLSEDLGSSKMKSGKIGSKLDQLFSVALRHGSDTLVREFNASYAFSRGLISALISLYLFFIIIDLSLCNDIPDFYHLSWILIIIAWFRAKDRAYYLARQYLYVYLNAKEEA